MYKKELQGCIEDIDAKIGEIKIWKEKEYHLITDESFLVCRCGGIISIADDGQAYGEMVDELLTSLTNLIREFRIYCEAEMEKIDTKDSKWNSYKAAESELKYLDNMFFGSELYSDPKTASIYIELSCKSFYSEVSKKTMAIVSLISFVYGPLSYANVIVTLKDSEESIQGVIDGISADISALEAVDKTGGVFTRLGGGAVVVLNNLYTLLSSFSNLFYVSYETWVEKITLTVFTDSYAHISKGMLGKSGKFIGEKNIKMYSKKDYNPVLNNGLGWEEDPGVRLKKLVHVKDILNGGEVFENKDYVEDSAPQY